MYNIGMHLMEAKEKVKVRKVRQKKKKKITSPDHFLGTNQLPMQRADRLYTSSVKRFMLAPHFSPQQQKIPALTPRQISHLQRYPCCHISSHSSRIRRLSPSRMPVPLQAGKALPPERSDMNQGVSAPRSPGCVCHQQRARPSRMPTFNQAAAPDGERRGQERARRAVPCKRAWQQPRRACGPAAPKEYQYASS